LVLQVTHDDGVSRTALGSFVLYGRDPHLASIGFVWNPLPSVVQLPLLPLLRPLGLQLLAGPLQSSGFMAGAVAVLWQYLGLFAAPARLRLALTGLFALNPMILLYAANGLSEASLTFFMLGGAYYLMRWFSQGHYANLIGAGFMTAGAFSTRYEAVPLAAGGCVAIVAAALKGQRLDPPRLEAMLLTYLAPVAYAVLLWLYFNRLIMGDALFFLRGTYSNTAQTVGFRGTGSYLAGVVGSLPGSTQYAGVRLLGNFVAFAPVLIGAVVLAMRRRDWRMIGLASIILAIPLFHTVLLYQGGSFGWLRFFMYSIPGAFLLSPLALPGGNSVLRSSAVAGLLVAFALSDGVTWLAMANPNYGREEYTFIERLTDPSVQLDDSRTLADERRIDAYINTRLSGKRILVDTVHGFAIVLLAQHPEQFVITSDRTFADVVRTPQGRVDYLLVPKPASSGETDLIDQTYPDLWAGGVTWATLSEDFGGDQQWRLYQLASR
ncbi:MAG: hypothetical protein JO247_21525, partial [Chloroflexi bacterium]|nr:hypothetical protein [Chloroflexota bacterium]